jgi:DNA repair exonuclease SbcCD nuclease subunit
VRLAHLADIHLGYRQYYRQTPAGLNQREADVASAFRDAIDDVIDARPDAVVIAGDLFHAVRPTNQSIVFCFRQLQRLREALPNAPVVLAAGNHDTPRATETGSILKLFAELGVHVVVDDGARLPFPDLSLSVLAVPHQAVVGGERLDLRPDGLARYQVLLIHGETPNLPQLDRWWADPAEAPLDPVELEQSGWSYVALGHYHVMRQVGRLMWYAGALDYVTPNPWGELSEQRKSGVRGKGWLLADLDRGTVERRFIEAPRGIQDLKPIDARDLSAAELDRTIAERLDAVPGGLADQVVRLVVHEVPRHVLRELDHAAIRAAKARALHLHLDFRRPDPHRLTGSGAPGRRAPLTEVLRDYLSRRPLPERVDRGRFVADGVALLESVGRDAEARA